MIKKNMMASYISGITDYEHGESYGTILGYFYPEFISALLLYSLPLWLDSWFVSQLGSTAAYATLGATNQLIHLIIKLAESISVGAIIMSGQYNGMKAYENVGRSGRDTFWITTLVGLVVALTLYFFAYDIYLWYGVSPAIIHLGIPFLQLRAASVLFTFIYFALVGFLRGVKNTKTPMQIFVMGSVIFMVFDYLLIFGHCGCPRMELLGSAVASLIQYASMSIAALVYIWWNPEYRKYGIDLMKGVADLSYIKTLFFLSWPVMIDKATMAWAYIWLGKMINPMGTTTVAAFHVVKDIERFAFLPAIAFAQVITVLVNNDYGVGQWEAIKSNLKKVCFLASLMVFCILCLFAVNPTAIIQFFDKSGEFTPLAAYAFPILSVLVFFDLVQLILSGALRGASNVRIVMYARLIICLGYFVPCSYFLSKMHFQDQALKFVLIYGSFYFGNALMSIAYINRFRSEEWKNSALKDTV